MINSLKNIKKVCDADRNNEDVHIDDRRAASNALAIRSMVGLVLFTCVAGAGILTNPLLCAASIIPITQSISDLRKHRFHNRIVRIHDEWDEEHKSNFK